MDNLKKLAQLLWATGGVLCLMVFFYQATPILLNASGVAWLQPLGICLMYSVLFILIASVFFTFEWLRSKLNDQRHLHETRRRYRRLNLQMRRQELQKQQKQSSYRVRLEVYRQRRRPLRRRSRPDE